MKDCPPTIDPAKLISSSLLRLRMKSPFFGTLAMFVRFVSSPNIATAATDGRDVFFNPEFLRSLPSSQQDGLILHEILHAALLHPSRLREREPKLWNVAADIVVNGMVLRESGLELPPGGLRNEQLEHLSVEEVYELLPLNESNCCQLVDPDLLPPTVGDLLRGTAAESYDLAGERPCQQLGCNPDRELAAYWQQAFEQAVAVAKSSKSGTMPLGIDREWGSVLQPQLDWRSYLWRYLVQNPTDFQGFDRRFVGRGLYLEALQGESIRVYIAIDTSGSISEIVLGLLIGEIRAVLAAYPHILCDLYYVDSAAYGPHVLTADSTLPLPQGGGGSSFEAFFDRVAETCQEQTQPVCIYLTDGYGQFPAIEPSLPTLWIVTPGGLDLAQFPFGEAVRLIEGKG